MFGIPRLTFWFSILGLLPFYLSTMAWYNDFIHDAILEIYGPPARLFGTYAIVVFGFLGGGYWAVVSRDQSERKTHYMMAIWPAFWIFFFFAFRGGLRPIIIPTGFALLLINDWYFVKQGLFPSWWMRNRIFVTLAILACYLVPIFDYQIQTILERIGGL
ncbi:hypothetical protein BFP76_09570 [Amylibacter kogurei]|uniref:DUF3429 domain-containing protein n=1 Tax=Paramylibacter kogurei TaxID=1889778 RepID=A0A2G5K158_9RHOB|nr:hypothetical protein BFP76_09570 [Amylibacter kogurei]